MVDLAYYWFPFLKDGTVIPDNVEWYEDILCVCFGIFLVFCFLDDVVGVDGFEYIIDWMDLRS